MKPHLQPSKLIVLLSFIFSGWITIDAQEANVYTNTIFAKNIKSLKMYPAGWEISDPVIELNSGASLEMRFDWMDTQAESIQYKVIHCDRNWLESDLLTNQYLNGFQEGYIEEMNFSFNTWVPFVSYALQLPNKEMQFKISGNYVLMAFLRDDANTPLFTYRFIVTETDFISTSVVKRSDLVHERNRLHEVDCNLLVDNRLLNPLLTVQAKILQNFRWDNSSPLISAKFLRGNELIFDYTKENSFEAGNEYRLINMKSNQYFSSNVVKFDDSADTLRLVMAPEINREKLGYSYTQDINGKYLIKNDDGLRDYTDADYLWVDFTLPFPEGPLALGNIYINGDFALNPYSENYRMNYNYATKSYEKRILLKQGYYNYQFLLLQDGYKHGTPDYIEGSYYETENNYTIIYYYRDQRLNADRVIGLQKNNSTNGF